ncbi:MAG: TonB-dependent receptor, partial [Myxococcales bacterium]|nr:TonB-dependent receptor [Myxococcales bacterium]
PEPAPPVAAPAPVAEPPPDDDAHRTVIRSTRPRTAASAQVVRDRDLKLRPVTRPADILQVAPGVVVVQHAGGGKANQYFLRGFDSDHGTDLALSVDGVPVNLPSHGHGQGFADLHWLIVDLVDRVEIDKGPYDVRNGDFATSGAINLVTKRSLDHTRVQYTLGRYGEHRGLFVAAPRWDGGSALIAGEARTWDGPFDSAEDAQRLSAFAKLSLDPSPATRVDLAATAYATTWNASGQIPERAIEAGVIDRFGSLDPTEGGNTQRFSVYGRLEHQLSRDERVEARLWFVQNKFQLFSNFTFFLEDPVDGDEIEQVDDRTHSGFAASWERHDEVGCVHLTHTLGLEARLDDIDNGLYHDVARARLGTTREDHVSEASIAFYGEESARLTDWLRLVGGSRVDILSFDVDGADGGGRSIVFASPKLSAILSPLPVLDVFLNFGVGFHSNDARAVVQGGTPFARATGGEVGVRVLPFDRLSLALAGYALHLESELVWVGDAGETEASGATTRLGIEAEARLAALDWLFFDLDVTYNHGRFDDEPDGADLIPLAPTFTASGGVSVRHPSGFYGRVGFRAISDRPAVEDDSLTADGFFLLDASAGYEGAWFDVRVEAENLTDTDYREAQFATTSRLAGEPPCLGGRAADGAGCADIDFTPGVPFNIRATVAFKL